MLNIIIFPIIFFFLNTSQPLKVSKSNLDNSVNNATFYLIKQYWHTAIVLKKKDIDKNLFPEVKMFAKYDLLDIGWGDAEFYQHPGFDLNLAFRALFYPTPGTLRMEGIGISKELYFSISEIVVEISVTKKQLEKIINYVEHSIVKDNNAGSVKLSIIDGGRIIFYKSKGEYNLFNTCNTWIARGLKKAGVKISDRIILTEQLFNEAAKVGIIIKGEE